MISLFAVILFVGGVNSRAYFDLSSNSLNSESSDEYLDFFTPVDAGGYHSVPSALGDLERQWREIQWPTERELKKRSKPFTVNVEGIVGTGKSTFLRFFKVKLPELVLSNFDESAISTISASQPRWCHSRASQEMDQFEWYGFASACLWRSQALGHDSGSTLSTLFKPTVT